METTKNAAPQEGQTVTKPDSQESPAGGPAVAANFSVQDGHNRFQLVCDDHGAVAIIEQDGEFWLGNDDLQRLLLWLLKRKGNR